MKVYLSAENKHMVGLMIFSTLVVFIFLMFIYPSLAVLSLIIFVPLMLSGFYLLISNNRSKSTSIQMFIPRISIRLLLIFYFTIFTASIVFFILCDRSFAYFGLLSLLFGITIYVCQYRRVLIVLLLCIMNIINIVLIINLSYGIYFGGGDLFNHMQYALHTVMAGAFVPADYDSAYHYFPLFPTMIASIFNITLIDIKDSLFLFNILISLITLIILYLIVSQKTNKLAGCFSVVLLSSLPIFLYTSYYPVSRSVSFVFALMIIYLFICRKNNFKTPWLILSFLLPLLLFNSIAIIQFIFILLVLWVVFPQNVESKQVMKRYLPLLIIIGITYWVYMSTSFSNDIIGYIFQIQKNEGLSPSSISIDYETFFYNHIPMMILISLSTIGLFFSRNLEGTSRSLALFCLFMTIFYIPNPIKMSSVIISDFGFYRFEYYSEIFISILGGLGIYYIYKFNKYKYVSIFILIIIMTCSFTAITNAEYSGMDETVPDRYFTIEELNCLKYVESQTHSNTSILSDYYVWRYFDSLRYYESYHLVRCKFYNSENIDILQDIDINNIVIIRTNELYEKNQLMAYNSNVLVTYSPDVIANLMFGVSCVFSDGANNVYFCS